MDPRSKIAKLLRPSASKRWLLCPASPGLQLANSDKVEDESSTFANEGTLAHAVAEAILNNRRPGPVFDDPRHPKVDKATREEILDHAYDYAEVVRAAIGPGRELFVEERVPLFYAEGVSFDNPEDGFGTCDAAVWDTVGKELHIFDLKYGVGVPVVAEENTQLLIYAYGLVKKYRDIFGEPVAFHFTIFQPRCRDELPAERTWGPLPEFELKKRLTQIQSAAYRIMSGDESELPACPSDDACRFCPCGAFCSARAKHLLDGLPMSEETPVTFEEPSALTTEKLKEVLDKAGGIRKFLGDVEEYLLDRAVNHNEDLPGWKVVESTKRRVWRDEDSARANLEASFPGREEDFTVTKLITPTQAIALVKKTMGKDDADSFRDANTLIPRGGPTLAPVTDKRPVFKKTDAGTEFGDTLE